MKGSSQRAELTKRFERERNLDQQRIENLTSDYKIIQEKHASGDLANAKDAREKNSDGGCGVDVEKHNRFAGFETRDKMVRGVRKF